MTEDDTYRRLKRIPFKDTWHIMQRLKSEIPNNTDYPMSWFDDPVFMKVFTHETGWTKTEWDAEYDKIQ